MKISTFTSHRVSGGGIHVGFSHSGAIRSLPLTPENGLCGYFLFHPELKEPPPSVAVVSREVSIDAPFGGEDDVRRLFLAEQLVIKKKGKKKHLNAFDWWWLLGYRKLDVNETHEAHRYFSSILHFSSPNCRE